MDIWELEITWDEHVPAPRALTRAALEYKQEHRVSALGALPGRLAARVEGREAVDRLAALLLPLRPEDSRLVVRRVTAPLAFSIDGALQRGWRVQAERDPGAAGSAIGDDIIAEPRNPVTVLEVRRPDGTLAARGQGPTFALAADDLRCPVPTAAAPF